MTTNTISDKKYVEGVWTSSALVLCPTCAKELKYTNDCSEEKIELDYLNDITVCNNCSKEMQVDNDVAINNNLSNRLKQSNINAYMVRLGGTNSACEIAKKDGKGCYWITFGSVSEGYLICPYDSEYNYLGDSNDFCCMEEDEIIEHVLQLKDIQRLEK